jgi:pyruvate-ferredoxin/flavodoxin oxidoreductase
LYRFNPDLEAEGKNPLIIDSKTDPSISFDEYALGENRYRTLKRVNPTKADALLAESQKDVLRSLRFLKSLATALEPEAKIEE